MKYKKLYWYIIDLEDINNPVAFNKPFRSKERAKKVRYRIFGKGNYLFKQGYELRSLKGVKLVPIPKSWMSISEKRISSLSSKERVKDKQDLLRKYKSLLKLKGTQSRSEFLNNLAKVTNL